MVFKGGGGVHAPYYSALATQWQDERSERLDVYEMHTSNHYYTQGIHHHHILFGIYG